MLALSTPTSVVDKAGYAPVPRPGERCWGEETRTGAPVLIEVSTVELVFKSGWFVWGWRPRRDERLPCMYFVHRPGTTQSGGRVAPPRQRGTVSGAR